MPTLPALLAVAAACAAPSTTPTWRVAPVTAPGVTHHTFPSALAGAEVSVHVFRPPSYDAQPDLRFPVLYWLHGTAGGTSGVAPIAAAMDAAMRSGAMPEALVVFPVGLEASLWSDATSGRAPVESVVIRELIPWVDAEHRTLTVREARWVEGFSMGGYGAARYALVHADLFGAASILAGGPMDPSFDGPRAQANPTLRDRILREVFGGDLEAFRAASPWTLAGTHADRVRGRSLIRVVVGEADPTAGGSRALSERLTQAGVEHRLVLLPGVDHETPELLAALGDDRWAFWREAKAQVGP